MPVKNLYSQAFLFSLFFHGLKCKNIEMENQFNRIIKTAITA